MIEGAYYGLDFKSNTVCAVGEVGNSAAVLIGRQKGK